MTRLGRDVGDQAVVEQPAVETLQDRSRGGAGIAVEHHRHAGQPRGEHGAGEGRQLVSTEMAENLQRITGCRLVFRDALRHDRDLVGKRWATT